MRTSLFIPAMMLTAVLAACGSGTRNDTATRETQAEDTAGRMSDMGDMGGMQDTSRKQGMHDMGGMMGSPMMQRMQEHMGTMGKASGDRMQAMLTTHRQMVANMLAQMNREMRQMNMTGDSAWTANMDSVRQDLIQMPELSSAELRKLMPAHRDRVMRLMEMHRSMMGTMKT